MSFFCERHSSSEGHNAEENLFRSVSRWCEDDMKEISMTLLKIIQTRTKPYTERCAAFFHSVFFFTLRTKSPTQLSPNGSGIDCVRFAFGQPGSGSSQRQILTFLFPSSRFVRAEKKVPRNHFGSILGKSYLFSKRTTKAVKLN